jgi:RND superfamily putative drug exporter
MADRMHTPRWLRVIIPVALIAVWFAAAGVGGPTFGQISDVTTNDQVAFLPASADATKVQDLQEDFRGSDSIPAIIVYQRDAGITRADRADVADQLKHISSMDGVTKDGVSPAIPSDDGKAMQAIVALSSSGEPSDTVQALRDYLEKTTPDGLAYAVTGPAGLTADLVGAFAGIDGLLLGVALAVVFVILIIVYRSPLLPIIVLGTSIAALTAALFVVVQLAKADVIALSGQTQGILMILVIGAATDYSLLYTARFREALRDHEKKWDATWAALRGSVLPILASAGTVMAGLLCLVFSELNSNKALGPVAAIGVAFALLAALTLLPALLFWAGRVAFWPVRPKVGSAHVSVDGPDAKGLWPAAARLVSTRPRTVWVTSALVLGVLAVGLVGLKADGVPQSDFVIGHSEARDGQAMLDAHFPGGSGTPALIVGPESKLDAMAERILGTDAVASLAVVSKQSPSGSLPVTKHGIESRVPGAQPTIVDGRVMLEATLDDPSESAAAEHTVRELRREVPDAADAQVLIGGVTATAIDTNDAAIHDRNLIIPLVLAVILVILMLLLRSVLAPVLLIGTVVLSFAAAMGVSAVVFDTIFHFPGADPGVPMFGFVFLVALGIDYNIFLMTRVREESAAHGTRSGVLRGLVATGGVITSAGVVLAATFAALGVLPVLFLAQIAFIVAFGVLLDTVVVRSLLVPALSYDIGRAIWWPSRLARGHR